MRVTRFGMMLAVACAIACAIFTVPRGGSAHTARETTDAPPSALSVGAPAPAVDSVLAMAWSRIPVATPQAESSGPTLALTSQEMRDPLIDPPEGGFGSRFQVVGLVDWTPGEQVTLRIAFTDAVDPFAYAGPFPYEQNIMVLRDATWSFPIVVRDDVLGFALPDQPGYLVVRADGSRHSATNVYVYTVDGARPPGAEEIADLGFGASVGGGGGVAVGIALFAAGLGVLLLASGAFRHTRICRDTSVAPHTTP